MVGKPLFDILLTKGLYTNIRAEHLIGFVNICCQDNILFTSSDFHKSITEAFQRFGFRDTIPPFVLDIFCCLTGGEFIPTVNDLRHLLDAVRNDIIPFCQKLLDQMGVFGIGSYRMYERYDLQTVPEGIIIVRRVYRNGVRC